jgi:hypothetical protein
MLARFGPLNRAVERPSLRRNRLARATAPTNTHQGTATTGIHFVFASYIAFQLINGLCAVILLGICRRYTVPWAKRQSAKWNLSSPVARLWLLEFPAHIVLCVVFAVFLYLVVQPLSRLATGKFPSLFVVVGSAFYSWLVAFPLLGLLRALRRGSAPQDRLVATCIAVLCAAVVIYSTLLEPNRVVLERHEVSLQEWPVEAEDLKVAILADVQSPLLGTRERRIPELVGQAAPHLILVPGDLIAQSFDDRHPIACARYLADRLQAPLGVFAVNGDVDQFVAGGLKGVLEPTAIRLLENESVLLPTDPPIELGGFDPLDDAGFQEHLQSTPLAAVRIAMVHRPRYAEEVQQAGYDLVISGHTHGGQVVLPGFGPLVTLSPTPREVGGGGLSCFESGAQLYVSRGIGMEAGFAPPIRFFCPPEVSLLTVRGQFSEPLPTPSLLALPAEVPGSTVNLGHLGGWPPHAPR